MKYSGRVSGLLYNVEGGGFVVFCCVVSCVVDAEDVDVVGGILCGVGAFWYRLLSSSSSSSNSSRLVLICGF